MKKDIKKSIIDATIKLINEKGSNIDDITVRDICREADVGVSLINYHFQTKENLIAQCVQAIIGDVIKRHEPWSGALPGKSLTETLEVAVNATLDYMYSVENISRISILTDHQNPKRVDNTFQSMEAFSGLIVKLCTEKNINQPRLILTMFIQSIQGAFLRTDMIKEDMGIDLRNPEERKKYINDYIDILFR